MEEKERNTVKHKIHEASLRQADINYWQQQLHGLAQQPDWPFRRSHPAAQGNGRTSHAFTLDNALSGKLLQLGNQSGYRLHMALLTGVAAMHFRCTETADLLVGNVAYRKDLAPGESPAILPVRFCFEPATDFRTALLNCRNTLAEAAAHPAHLQSGRLFDPANQVYGPFSIAVALLNIQDPDPLLDSECPLVLCFEEKDGNIFLTLHAGEAFLEDWNWADWFGNFQFFLTAALTGMQEPLHTHPLTEPRQVTRIMETYNQVPGPFPASETIHGRFRQMVIADPHQTALLHDTGAYSFEELDRMSQAIALSLQRAGIGQGHRVGLLCRRTPAMIAAMLGILKLGAAYVPLDTQYPGDRIRFIIADAGLGILLTDQPDYPAAGSMQLADALAASARAAEDLPAHTATGNDTAYIIYTSGSTGLPKGVDVLHGNCLNFLNWAANYFEPEKRQCILACTSVCFDLSVFEIFLPLTTGQTIALADHLFQWPAHPAAARVTLVNTVPSVMAAFISASGLPESVRVINLAGEPLRRSLVNEIKKSFTGEICNLYGPTETTTYSTGCRVDCNGTDEPKIGRPVDNTLIYMLDAQLNHRPPGWPGEIYIGGHGVARGYLNRPDLNAEKFLPDPHYPGYRMYKTGDWGYWNPGGDITCIGRMDNQVKIRGFRIELGEIEKQLLQVPGIKEAAVVVNPDSVSGEPGLVAYVQPEHDRLVQEAELKEWLAARVPAYMVPHRVIRLQAFPLTPNGKTDRKALAALPVKGRQMEYAAPLNSFQETLAGIWTRVMRSAEPLGIDHDFFALGGTSLLALRIVHQVWQETGTDIPAALLLSCPTIRLLTQYITENSGNAAMAAIPPAGRRRAYPVSSAQKRVYINHYLDHDGLSSNMPIALAVKGQVDRRKLEASLRKLVGRHAALRTSFFMENGELMQRVEEEADFNLYYRKSATDTPDVFAGNFVRPFDLARAPLFRAGFLEKNEEEGWLMLDMHHIISDGQSVEILIEELVKLYKGETLPPPGPGYTDYAVWQNSQAYAAEAGRQERYWEAQLATEWPELALPPDYIPVAGRMDPQSLSVLIHGKQLDTLRAVAAEKEITMYMMLMAAYTLVLQEYAGQTDLVVGTTLSGRVHTSLNGIVGMFVNTLPLRLQPHPEKKLNDYLREVKTKMLELMNNQWVQFDDLARKLPAGRNGAGRQLFQTSFLYYTLERQAYEMEGLTLKRHALEGWLGLYDLTLEAVETPSELKMDMEYNAALFRKDTMAGLLNRMTGVLTAFAGNGGHTLSDLSGTAREHIKTVEK